MPIRRWTRPLAGVLLAGTLVACGGTADDNVGVFKSVPDVVVAGSVSNDLTIDSADGATLAFAKTELTAGTGEIKVTFNNKGVVPHNWVLVNPGEEDKTVADAANATNFEAANALAHTKTIDGGANDTATFNIAEPGTYSYVCTYPGHYAAGMKGTFKVVAAGGGGAAPAGGGAGLTVNSGDAASMTFAETELSANAGEVTVSFNNAGTLPHNLVIVKPGEEQKAVDSAVANAPDFTPSADLVLGTTKTINGGETASVSATLEPGTYSYICAYPGHFASGMKGTLTVK
ncbi:plastocyanin/azurin family copper-binding protein [Herpetosiphon llansteffanensis]|uniref:plastocyanin/azurin family copper-binding protein n=1 Tax=Herpetosiphon llansteffanensis TaxID=2094568 RepID=UPI0013DFCE8E|nr:plastocyanin/azurin family copper-binding protein [Herpetosiphon llansteffanensis]